MPRTEDRRIIGNSEGGPQLRLPEGESDELHPQDLLLDPQNLRLLERIDDGIHNIPVKLIGQRSIQDKLFETIYTDPLFDIAALETSILFNGFLKHEHLIVARYDSEKYLVLEGNRRLTAVKHIYAEHGPHLANLPLSVKQSLRTLPCFVIKGEAINNSPERLREYRRASEIYIGMRHLMGAKSWEPASRYEFQARLILEESWTPEQVAQRFGRDRSEVIRDLKAQRLYQDFRNFERKTGVAHTLTYNAFAEAARAPSIMRWLGWSNAKMTVIDREKEQVFFHYLVSRLRVRSRVPSQEGEEETPQESAEAIVRRLREMLKLGDETVEGALMDRDFDSADLLFEERREGAFAKRIATYIRGLKRVTGDELSENARENKSKLNELIDQARKTLILVDAILKK